MSTRVDAIKRTSRVTRATRAQRVCLTIVHGVSRLTHSRLTIICPLLPWMVAASPRFEGERTLEGPGDRVLC